MGGRDKPAFSRQANPRLGRPLRLAAGAGGERAAACAATPSSGYAVFSTSAIVLIAWSMCDSSTISGGDRAMMSPVVRISTPRSKHVAEDVEARACPARPAIDSSSMRADQADVAHVDHVRRLAQRMQRVLEHRRHLRAARQQAFVGIGLERAERRGAGERMGRVGVAVRELDHVLGPGHEDVVDRAASRTPRPSARSRW